MVVWSGERVAGKRGRRYFDTHYHEETRSIPATIRAAAINGFGPPSVLRLRRLPVPEVGPHEVLIALHAVGVGIWDAKVRDGSWASGRERFPLVPGTDGAGLVAAKGARVRRFSVGDRVYAYKFENPKGGFYAEYVANRRCGWREGNPIRLARPRHEVIP